MVTCIDVNRGQTTVACPPCSYGVQTIAGCQCARCCHQQRLGRAVWEPTLCLKRQGVAIIVNMLQDNVVAWRFHGALIYKIVNEK